MANKKIMVGNTVSSIPTHGQFVSGDSLVDPLGNPLSGGGGGMQASNNLSDVSNIVTARSNLGVNYDLSMFFAGTPNANQNIFAFINRMSVPIQMALQSISGNVGTNPSASTSFTIVVDGVTNGSVTVSTGGVISSTGSATALQPGKVVKITAPATLNSVADIAFVIPATY
jgi:hypothetical protein